MRSFAVTAALALSLMAAGPNGGASASPLGGAAPASASIGQYIAEAAQRFGVPAPWIEAVIRVESGGHADAVSRAGAMGFMQLMPDTWTMLRVRLDLGADPFDPRDNILAGTAYLRDMFDRYGAPGFLAAYNAGPARYDAYLRGERALPIETRAYLDRLTPVVTASPRGTVTPLDPDAWRRASLFAASPAPTEQPEEAREPPPLLFLSGPESASKRRSASSDETPADALFVRRAAAVR